MGNLFVGGLRGIRFDVHDQRLQAGRLDGRHAILDLFLACRCKQDLHIVRAAGRRAEHLEIQIHLIEREGNDLVGLGLHLVLQVDPLEAGRGQDLFGDDGRRRQCQGHILDPRPQILPSGPQSIGHLIEIGDIAVCHGILGQGLDDVAFHPQHAFPCVGQLHQFDRSRTDVEPQDGQTLGRQPV
ncbi:hypothetical protein SDC9_174592 [bioreactor metagenome]|uniref:Uncharacterized protein n=1 Tax=bioreactor metagenome TaxID=1076179 RepID=A0A645GKB9_9ZZZZ